MWKLEKKILFSLPENNLKNKTKKTSKQKKKQEELILAFLSL